MANDHLKEMLKKSRSQLYTAVIGDTLDILELQHQFLPAEIRPMLPQMKVVGLAMPVLMMDVYGTQTNPFGLLTNALDDLQEDEVYIAGGASHRSANWGELLTAAAIARGAAGAVVDGYHRDTPNVLTQDLPVFSIGSYGQDSGPRMKVAAYRVEIEIGNTRIRPGDVIFGDVDGVVVIPQERAEHVITLSLDKARTEKTVRKSIEDGMSATKAFKTYGVL